MMGFCSLVFLVLLVLKLCGLALISWWWVFSPLIVLSVFWCVLIPFLFVVAVLGMFVKEFGQNGRV